MGLYRNRNRSDARPDLRDSGAFVLPLEPRFQVAAHDPRNRLFDEAQAYSDMRALFER